VSAAKKKAAKPKKQASTRENPLAPNERGNYLLARTEELDRHVSDLHAAVLFLRGEFITAPSKAFEIIDNAIELIRWEVATLRGAGFGLYEERRVPAERQAAEGTVS
jgi:hypothetical protein